MVINKHGSFYMRNGWGTKIIQAVSENDMIFTPSNEQEAVDELGLGRVMIKALRYWAEAMGLVVEEKSLNGIRSVKTELFDILYDRDKYFQHKGSLLLLHRNLCINIENATAWYWMFNEFGKANFEKEEFVDGLHSYLAVNNMKIKKAAVVKEYNCLKNTYIGEKRVDIMKAIDENAYPFFAPLSILKTRGSKEIEKKQLISNDIPWEILLYSIISDNSEECSNGEQLSIDKIMEDKMQVGKYYNIKYSKLIEMLLIAENKGLINLNNNFGNRHIEILHNDKKVLLESYYNNTGR